MKRFLAAAFALLLVLATLGVTAFAEDTVTADVYVTISDANGKLVLAQEKITVRDVDGDGALTVNDALYCAHEAKFEGGAEAGYSSYEGAYGLALEKLWGVENGGSYGYCVNNASAMSLADPIKDGDRVQAYCYTDLAAWSDTFSFFDVISASVEEGEATKLTLYASGYDENWNPVTSAVAVAKITVNGVETDLTTDEHGEVTITLDEEGEYIISATSENMTLVPPVCTVTVIEKADTAESSDATSDESTTPPTGDSGNTTVFALIALASLAGVAVAAIKNR